MNDKPTRLNVIFVENSRRELKSPYDLGLDKVPPNHRFIIRVMTWLRRFRWEVIEPYKSKVNRIADGGNISEIYEDLISEIDALEKDVDEKGLVVRAFYKDQYPNTTHSEIDGIFDRLDELYLSEKNRKNDLTVDQMIQYLDDLQAVITRFMMVSGETYLEFLRQ